jgi:dynein heavy chain
MISELSKNILPQYISADIRLAYEAVYYASNSQNFEALVQSTKGSLDLLRSGLGTYTVSQYNKPPSQKPFFKAEILLLIPNVVMQPKLEDIQTSLNKIAGLIVDVSKKNANNEYRKRLKLIIEEFLAIL